MTSLHDELEKKLQDPNATPMFLPLEFLKIITCDFSTESELSGGGYGVVYKGVLPSEKIIAVKKLFEIRLKHEAFQNEICYLMGIKHQNVVKFIGYCAESRWEAIEEPSGSGKHILAEIPKRLLCFEYVSNKSLDKHIAGGEALPLHLDLEWNVRYKIIMGICNGLHFLHEECCIIHLDLKPENILMDSNMKPKIADFGLSRIFGEQHSKVFTDNHAGTCGYMAPEYLTQGLISKKADIFSLGVIIIEVVTGCREYPYFKLDSPESTATSCQHFTEEVLGSWRYKFESQVKYISMEKYNQQIKQCIVIALKCVNPCMDKRPTAKDVIQLLNAVDQVIPSSSILLDVYPLQLRFLFEPNKLIACSLDLTNNTYEQVAFGLLKKSNEQTCFLSCLPMFGIVDPGTTYTLAVIMNEHECLPQERNVDLILQTCTYYGILSDKERCKKHFQNAAELGNIVHTVTLKGVCGLQGETIFEKSIGSIEIPYSGALSVKFIARKGWFLVGTGYGSIHVFNYKEKMKAIKSFKVPQILAVRSLAIHPTQPYVLAACDTHIKLWDWEQDWKCMQTLEEHSSEVRAVAFNPEDYNSFASASDRTIKNAGNNIPLTKQFLYFASTKSKMEDAWGTHKVTRLLANSFFLLGIGSNDLFQTSPKTAADVATIYATHVSNYSAAIADLYGMGARKFGIINVGPIGCFPRVRVLNKTGVCNEALNRYAAGFAAIVKLALTNLASKLPCFSYSLADSFAVFNSQTLGTCF
ncbi:hypothetical protein ACQ4PT_061724 [Festuca glaucescens]